VDLRSVCGRSSVVSGRWRGLRLESTQAHFQTLLPRLDLLIRAGFFVGPYPTGTVGSYCRSEVGIPGSVSLRVLVLTAADQNQ
jgi:hypothetical protein